MAEADEAGVFGGVGDKIRSSKNSHLKRAEVYFDLMLEYMRIIVKDPRGSEFSTYQEIETPQEAKQFICNKEMFASFANAHRCQMQTPRGRDQVLLA